MGVYRVLRGVTRRSDGRYFPAGAEVELELSPEDEAVLIERGVIERKQPIGRAKSEEESDGEV